MLLTLLCNQMFVLLLGGKHSNDVRIACSAGYQKLHTQKQQLVPNSPMDIEVLKRFAKITEDISAVKQSRFESNTI